MRSSDNCDRVICCCGSGLECFEKFLDNGKSIGFFCTDCFPWRIGTFTQDDAGVPKDDV